jgi:hypothetical protein
MVCAATFAQFARATIAIHDKTPTFAATMRRDPYFFFS